MVLVQHHRDLAVAFAEHDGNVPANHHSQTLLGIGNLLGRTDHPLLGEIHGMRHQVEKDFVFTLEMMVEPAFAQPQGRSDVVHRRAVITLLLKQARRGAQNFLARISRSFTGHGGQYTNFAAALFVMPFRLRPRPFRRLATRRTRFPVEPENGRKWRIVPPRSSEHAGNMAPSTSLLTFARPKTRILLIPTD